MFLSYNLIYTIDTIYIYYKFKIFFIMLFEYTTKIRFELK